MSIKRTRLIELVANGLARISGNFGEPNLDFFTLQGIDSYCRGRVAVVRLKTTKSRTLHALTRLVICFDYIAEFEITSIIVSANVSGEMREMVDCPECGKPLVKGSLDSEYYCENKNCPVALVRCPHESDKMKVAYTSFAREYLHKSNRRSLWKT